MEQNHRPDGHRAGQPPDLKPAWVADWGPTLASNPPPNPALIRARAKFNGISSRLGPDWHLPGKPASTATDNLQPLVLLYNTVPWPIEAKNNTKSIQHLYIYLLYRFILGYITNCNCCKENTPKQITTPKYTAKELYFWDRRGRTYRN
jgi:hypothetical protein